MRRKLGNGRLSRGGFDEEDINPMDGLANLADIMLVFACGLMLALIANWNIDIGGTGSGSGSSVSVSQGQEVSELQGLTDSDGGSVGNDSKYEKMGVVYKDPETGKLYMVTADGDN